jgi:arginyl-tRNA--protein-N-Asp/Glu arginylyltransferase
VVSGSGAPEPARARLAALLDGLGLEASSPSPCPYLPGRDSRLVVVRPERLIASLYQLFLDLNYRRLGSVVYRPQCDGCSACRQLRLPIAAFRPTRAQRRCWRRNEDVTAVVGRPEATDEKHAVYRRYLESRHDGQMSGSREEFVDFLHDASDFTEEVVFRVGGRLLGAGIYDATPQALSAVYFYFDPELAGRAPGIFNVLWLVEQCRRRALPWLYLGYHVAGSRVMEYKASFRPHEALGEDGRWR